MTGRDYPERTIAHDAAAAGLAAKIRGLKATVMLSGLQYEAIPWWRPLERRRTLRELEALGEEIACLRGELARGAADSLAAAARVIWAYVPAAREVAP
ncbi:MAG: hypothetical protein JWM19_905 [Actinomycetia bacterium]|nr:hypothetical protein [Actinomycetes bacterium]